jgi:hypothetical protein
LKRRPTSVLSLVLNSLQRRPCEQRRFPLSDDAVPTIPTIPPRPSATARPSIASRSGLGARLARGAVESPETRPRRNHLQKPLGDAVSVALARFSGPARQPTLHPRAGAAAWHPRSVRCRRCTRLPARPLVVGRSPSGLWRAQTTPSLAPQLAPSPVRSTGRVPPSPAHPERPCRAGRRASGSCWPCWPSCSSAGRVSAVPRLLSAASENPRRFCPFVAATVGRAVRGRCRAQLPPAEPHGAEQRGPLPDLPH